MRAHFMFVVPDRSVGLRSDLFFGFGQLTKSVHPLPDNFRLTKHKQGACQFFTFAPERRSRGAFGPLWRAAREGRSPLCTKRVHQYGAITQQMRHLSAQAVG